MGPILASDSTAGLPEASGRAGWVNGNASVTVRIVQPGSAEERALSGHREQEPPFYRPYTHANETAAALGILFLLLMWIASMTMTDLTATNETKHNAEKNKHA